MQILYAAPFLLLAAISFFVCSVVGAFRKHALVVPVGVLSFGVTSLIIYMLFALLSYKFGYHGPATWLYLIVYILGGVIGAVFCAYLFRVIVAMLPAFFISAGLVSATLASSLVLLIPCNVYAASLMASHRLGYGWLLAFWIFIASIVSWKLVTISAQFRPSPCLS